MIRLLILSLALLLTLLAGSAQFDGRRAKSDAGARVMQQGIQPYPKLVINYFVT